VKIEVVQVPEQNAVFAKATCKHSEIGDAFHKLLPAVANYMEATSATMAGPPFCRYTDWREEDCDIEVGCPIAESLTGEGEVFAGVLGADRAVRADYSGPYEGLHAAHAACRSYIEENGLEPSAPPFEIYATDPDEEPNPEKWITQVYWPVAP
jgi:effector-binding domain-containing protein